MVDTSGAGSATRSLGPSGRNRWLDYALHCASTTCASDGAILAVCADDSVEIINSHGLSHTLPPAWRVAPGTRAAVSAGMSVFNAPQASAIFQNVPFVAPDWRSICSIPVWQRPNGDLVFLMMVDSRRRAARTFEQNASLLNIVSLLQYHLKSIDRHEVVKPHEGMLAVGEAPASYALRPAVVPGAPNEGFTLRFLLKTLLVKHRILQRDTVSYHVLRTWRSGYKEHQIQALRTLKQTRSAELADVAAREIVQMVESIVGRNVFQFVTNVPCGNSGSECLALAIATRAAAELSLPHVRLFADLPIQGSSHPKRNLERPAMRMIGSAVGNGLLIDDVVTSGSHLSEACGLMRSAGNGAFPIAWIGA